MSLKPDILAPAAGHELPFPYGLGEAGIRDTGRTGGLVWIRQAALAREHGRLSGRGLAGFGIDPGRMLLVEAKGRVEALQAAEEASRASGLAAVIAELDDMDFTASRRLGLACEASRTPLVLVFPHTRSGATAAQGRWRVSARPSAPHEHDARAPGRPAWRAILEKSRLQPGKAGRVFDLEYDDATPCLRLVSRLAARPAAPQPRRIDAGLGGVWRDAG
jgi:protein ImuA